MMNQSDTSGFSGSGLVGRSEVMERAAMKQQSTRDQVLGACASEPPIRMAFSRLDSAITNLAGLTDVLSDRLSPILSSPRPECENACDRGMPGESPVMNAVEESARRVDNIAERLSRLLTRIEL